MDVIKTISLIAFFIILYVIYRSVFENKIRQKWLRIAIDTTLVVVIIPFCVNFLDPFFEREEREKEEIFRKQVLDAIVQEGSNTQDIEELIALKYKDIFDSSDEDAKKWADEFIKSLPDKQAELESLLIKGLELEKRLTLKWQPLYKFILKEFDARVLKLKENNLIKSFNKKEQSIFRKDAFEKYNSQIRTVVFKNGSYILIEFRPALIQMTFPPGFIPRQMRVSGSFYHF